MPAKTASDRHLVAQIAAHESWAQTPDRSARTAPARAALDQKFLDLASGDPIRAAHLRKAHFARLALRSAQARRRKIEVAKAELPAVAVELEASGGLRCTWPN
jgi:hypothetical protein